jgi:error-prone DNA polymerase
MVKGLSNAHAAEIVTARGDSPYQSAEGLWRRARVTVAALQRLAEADAFRGLGLDRREALWAIRGLRDEVLPLFAAADAEHMPRPELLEPPVTIVPMIGGREVVEDYTHVGLTLRQHPVEFLRDTLRQRGVFPCAQLQTVRDGQRVTIAGLVLVRQRPGTATGVIFITLEDETGIANLVIWSSLFEQQRGVVLSASMLECRGRVQRKGDVIHVVAEQLGDLTPLLRTVGSRHRVQPDLPGNHDESASRRQQDSSELAHSLGDHPLLRDTPAIQVPTRSFH